MKGCRPLTDDEIQILFESGFTGTFATRDKALVALGLCTGYRISELLSIKVGQVWINSEVTHYLRVEKRYMKQKKESRTKELTPEARHYIREWLTELKQIKKGLHSKMYLFASREGLNRPIRSQTANKALKLAFERVGIVESPRILATHCMRKTFADRVNKYFHKEYKAGNITHEPLILTKEALGHKSVENTLKYLSFTSGQIPQEVLKIPIF